MCWKSSTLIFSNPRRGLVNMNSRRIFINLASIGTLHWAIKLTETLRVTFSSQSRNSRVKQPIIKRWAETVMLRRGYPESMSFFFSSYLLSFSFLCTVNGAHFCMLSIRRDAYEKAVQVEWRKLNILCAVTAAPASQHKRTDAFAVRKAQCILYSLHFAQRTRS